MLIAAQLPGEGGTGAAWKPLRIGAPKNVSMPGRKSPVKAKKKERTVAKRRLKTLMASFAQKLVVVRKGLDADEEREHVLGILHDDLKQQLDGYVARGRQRLVSAVEKWWDKYRVTLRDTERERDEAKNTIDSVLEELGLAV